MASNLKSLVFEKPWLLEEEKNLAKQFLREMFTLFRRHGVETTPILLFRMDDVLYSYMTVRRLESASSTTAPSVPCDQEASETESQKREPKPKKDGDNSQLEVLGKARDRLRKAMKELEEGCVKAFKPLSQGIADRMKPVLKKADGVLEESLRTEIEEDDPD